MGFFDLLKKGLGFVLLSFGVSRPAPKAEPKRKPEPPIRPGE
jgi:hypothetical protein